MRQLTMGRPFRPRARADETRKRWVTHYLAAHRARGSVLVVLGLCLSSPSWAETTGAPTKVTATSGELTPRVEPRLRTQVALEGGAIAGNLEAGAQLTARFRLPRGLQIGLLVAGARPHETFISGYPTRGGWASEGRGWLLGELIESGPLVLALRGGLGVRSVVGADPTAEGRNATRVLSELKWLAHIACGPRAVLRIGPTLGVDMEVAPTFDLASLAQLIALGGSVFLSEHWALSADFETGGSYGFNGNNEKYIYRGQLGLMYRFSKQGDQPWLVF